MLSTTDTITIIQWANETIIWNVQRLIIQFSSNLNHLYSECLISTTHLIQLCPKNNFPNIKCKNGKEFIKQASCIHTMPWLQNSDKLANKPHGMTTFTKNM